MMCVAGTTAEGYEIDKIYSQPLGMDQEAVLIYENEDLAGEHRIQDFRISTGNLWVKEVTYESDGMYTELWKMNLTSGEREVVLSENNSGFSWVMIDGDLYYSEYDASNDSLIYGPIYKWDLQDQEKEEFCTAGGRLTYDGTYIYVFPTLDSGDNGNLQVYNLGGELVAQADNQQFNGKHWMNYYITSSRYVISYSNDHNADYMIFLNKEDLFDNNLEWHSVKLDIPVSAD